MWKTHVLLVQFVKTNLVPSLANVLEVHQVIRIELDAQKPVTYSLVPIQILVQLENNVSSMNSLEKVFAYVFKGM